MRRRTCLGALAAGFAAVAGCSSGPAGGATTAADEGAFTLKAMRADPNATRVQCTLNESFVAEHGVLSDLFDRADATDGATWVRRSADRATAVGLHEALHGRCGESNYGGVYHYGGRSYFVSIEKPSSAANATESANATGSTTATESANANATEST